MHDEEDIERSAAFDELLREHAAVISDDIDPTRMQTIRLLHEVFRAPASLPDSDSPATEPPLPERIGRFRIRRQLGRGGFGTVYLAEDPLLNRQVAVKVIHSHWLLDPAMRSRALREREAMARLQHPNIIPVWEASEDQDQLFIVSEYCDGQSLAEWLATHPEPMSGKAAAGWLSKLADAVAHSHDRGVIHRDLKPGNILLDPLSQSQAAESADVQNLEPRLSDFGLAKILDRSGARNNSASAANIATQSGLFVGSLEYASPEQVKGHLGTIGPATDIFALGVLLYQLLTGRLPHSADSQYELARKICEDHARFSSEDQAIIPKDLQAITLRAMAIKISDRYPSAGALRDDLERYLREEPVEARPVSPLEQLVRLSRKRPAVTALATICCLLTLMYLYNLVVSNRRLSEQSQALTLALTHAREQTRLAENGQRMLNQLRYRETLKLAFEQWQENNYIGLHDSLARLSGHQPSTMELAHLRRQLAAVYLKFDLRDQPVHALAWHPAEKQILSISANGSLRRWCPDRASALSEQTMAVGAHALAIHPDGKTLAIPENVMATFDPQNQIGLSREASASRITLWNAPTAKQAQEPIQFHTRTVESLEFSPDGRWLAAGPRYTNVVVTDLDTQEPFAYKAGRRNRQVLFSPGSDRIAVYSDVGVVDIYDLRTHNLLTSCKLLFGSQNASCYSMAWVPGEESLVVNATPHSLDVYSTLDGHRQASVQAGMEGETIAISPDAKHLALGDNSGFVKVFDLKAILAGTDEAVAVTPGMRVMSGKVLDMAFIDEHRLVAADEEGNMIQLTLPNSPLSLQFDGRFSEIHWHDNQHLWAFGSDGRSIGYVNVGQNRLELRTDLPPHADGEVARVENSKHIARVNREGVLSVVQSDSGKELSTCRLPPGNALQSGQRVSDCLLFSADGQVVYATGNNNKLCAVRISDGKILWTLPLTNTGHALVEDVQRRHLYLGGGFEQLTIVDAISGKVVDTQIAGNGTHALMIHAGRRRLFSGHHDGTVRQRNLGLSPATETATTINRLASSSVTALTLSPDGRTLVVGGEDGIVRLADEETNLYGILYRSKLRDAEVARLKWSHDNRRLAALILSRKDQRSELVIFDRE